MIGSARRVELKKTAHASEQERPDVQAARTAERVRLVASIPHGHWETLTFIAALRHDQLTVPWVIDGPMDGDAFVQYIETQLAPTLEPGDVVVLDSLSAHNAGKKNKPSKSAGLGCCFCHHIFPTLTSLSWYSQSSRPTSSASSRNHYTLERHAICATSFNDGQTIIR